MNVGELKKIVGLLPDDMEVICAERDEPYFSPLASTSHAIYWDWSGVVGILLGTESKHADHNEVDEERWRELTSQPKALILEPKGFKSYLEVQA